MNIFIFICILELDSNFAGSRCASPSYTIFQNNQLQHVEFGRRVQSGARFSTEALDLCKHAQTWSSDGLRRSDAGEQGDNGGDHEGE